MRNLNYLDSKHDLKGLILNGFNTKQYSDESDL